MITPIKTLSGKSSTHDTVITLFQEIPSQPVSKPSKSKTNLNAIKTLSKLACQEVSPFKSNKNLISPSFKADENLYQNEAAIKTHETMEFIISAMKGIASKTNEPLPSWAGIQALLSSAKVPLMQVGFLPFLPYPVTEYSTAFTAMLNFVKVLKKLKQKSLPVFADEGGFRIMLDIYLKCPEKFSDLVPMLKGFHIAKCVHRCIGKYTKDTGLEDALVETGVFGPKVIESFIAETDYVRSMRGIQILSTAIQMVKWKAFWTMHDRTEFIQVTSNLLNLIEAL